MKKYLLLLCLFLSTITQLYAQEKWLNYTYKNDVRAMAFEGDNIWIATTGGVLVRNTKTGAIVAEYSKVDGLVSNDVGTVVIDKQGDKWFGTPSGVSRYNGSTWTSYTASNSGLASDGVNAIAIDKKGNKWFGTYNSGISKFDGANWTTFNSVNSDLVSNYLTSIEIDTSDAIWFATQNGVSKYEDTIWTTYNTSNSGLIYDNVHQIVVDTSGAIWFATPAGISKYEDTTWATYNTSNTGLVNNYVFSIAIDKQGVKWFATENGVSKYDGTKWSTYNASNTGLDIDLVKKIAIDFSGNLWVRIHVGGGGVAKFNGKVWSTYNSGLQSNYVNTIIGETSGTMWIGTFDRGVSRYNNREWLIYNSFNSDLEINNVKAITTDSLGNVWMGIDGGVSKYNGINWANYNSSNSGLTNNYVKAIATDDLGNIWFGTFDRGVSKYNGNTWTTYNISNSGLSRNYVNAIATDDLGNIWFGTQGGGVSKYNGSTWTTYNTSNSGLAFDNVNAIITDVLGNLWFGTSSGVSLYDGSTWTTFNTSNSGLSSNSISTITMDSLGNVWFGTWGDGVSKFDGIRWMTYNSENSGLAHNSVRSIAIDVSGNVWIGTWGGGVSVLLNSVQLNNPTKHKKTVLGKVYLDKNQNQLLDNGENYLGNQKVLFNPNNAIAFTNTNGEYVFQADSGSSYTIGYAANNIFELTKDTVYTEIVKTDTVFIPDFPVYSPDTTIYRSNISSIDRGRCNTEAPVWFTYSNRGTTTDDLQVVLTLDADIQVKGSFPTYDSIANNTLYYSFPQFKAGADRQIKLNIQNPTFLRMGDTLVFASKLTAGGMDFTTSTKTVITCSYDPNDKAVQPLPIGEENYTLKNEVLSYTVRFQNTGNDTAFYVAIKDTLDKNLDWNTFEVLGSSHIVNTTMDSSGVVTFEFANIVLPDSATNEPASNGFVSYSIQAPKTVAENTIVKNTAHIYFDQNPAIVTNTTINNLVTTIPNPSVGFENDLRITKSVLYPNPLTGSSILKFENKGTDATLQVQDVSGKVIFTKTSTSNEFVLHKNEFEATGLFIYTIQTENELLSGKVVVE